MKILLIKRLESSFHAFRLTLDRFIRSYERVIEEFDKGHVYISKKHINKIFDLLETDNQEAIDRLLEADKAERLDAKDFNADFIRDLESDLRDPAQGSATSGRRIKRDPKWEAFCEMLRGRAKVEERQTHHLHRIEGNCRISRANESRRSRARRAPVYRRFRRIRPQGSDRQL